jgi:hypothetical protein
MILEASLPEDIFFACDVDWLLCGLPCPDAEEEVFSAHNTFAEPEGVLV